MILPIQSLYLDPNNPRLWNQISRSQIPDSRIIDAKIQTRTLSEIEGHGIEELHYSILRNGFMLLDRIVVRPIKREDEKYVVVEGNRRLAALMLLRQRISDDLVVEDHAPPEYLEKLVSSTDELNVLVYRGADDTDISWILQGIRHIGGIRSWEPAQRAKLVAGQIDEYSFGFRETGQKFGLTARSVGRLYRAHKALEQMRTDDEFGRMARNDYFSLFEEAYRNRSVRDWLRWNEEKMRFDGAENLEAFYSWIVPDEENDGNRRIHDPKHVKLLGTLISGEHKRLVDQVDQHEIGIERAASEAEGQAETDSWRSTIQRSIDLIKSLNVDVISNNPNECRNQLKAMVLEVEKVIAMAEAVLGQHEDK